MWLGIKYFLQDIKAAINNWVRQDDHPIWLIMGMIMVLSIVAIIIIVKLVK